MGPYIAGTRSIKAICCQKCIVKSQWYGARCIWDQPNPLVLHHAEAVNPHHQYRASVGQEAATAAAAIAAVATAAATAQQQHSEFKKLLQQ